MTFTNTTLHLLTFTLYDQLRCYHLTPGTSVAVIGKKTLLQPSNSGIVAYTVMAPVETGELPGGSKWEF